jgi:hypothetical protein
VAILRIERRVDAGADADFEDAVTGPDPHAIAGDKSAGMERRTENYVVDTGQLFVNACNEIVLDRGDRQRPGGHVGSEVRIFVLE